MSCTLCVFIYFDILETSLIILSGCSKTKGHQSVQAILTLDSSIASEKALIVKLQQLYTSDHADVQETFEQLQDSKAHLKQLQASRQHKFSALGVSDQVVLNTLKNNAFLQSCLNALALKQCLRDKLRQCKFEIEKLERSYHCTVNGTILFLIIFSLSTHYIFTEVTSHNHIQGSLSRRAPTIQRLAKTYNDLCHNIASMISRGQAPSGAVCPQPIPDGGLWKLDVDDDIWQDVGLENEPTSAPPLWLADEATRAGIHSLLDFDCCCEEEAHLI